MTSTYYWDRALMAIEKRRRWLRLLSEDDEDLVWKEVNRLTWLEQFARQARQMTEDMDIF